MTTVAQSDRTVEFDILALRDAVERATAAYPIQAARIDKGLALALDDAVTDMQLVKPRWFRVRSAVDPTTQYDVFSNGDTVCSCPDYESHGMAGNLYVCKHGWAVLLVRAARRDSRPVGRLRHAYHCGGTKDLAEGIEGYMRYLSDGRAQFWPGGQKYSFTCMRDELYIGKCVEGDGRPY